MRIRISTIPADGLKIVDKIPVTDLNRRLNEGHESEISFLADPAVDLTVHRNPNGAETKGKVVAAYKQPCARCDDRIGREIELPVDYILKRRLEETEGEDDIGIAYFEGDHFDLEELIQETLILALSLYWSPPLDESEGCTACPRSFAAPAEGGAGTVTMGDLLKGIKVK